MADTEPKKDPTSRRSFSGPSKFDQSERRVRSCGPMREQTLSIGKTLLDSSISIFDQRYKIIGCFFQNFDNILAIFGQYLDNIWRTSGPYSYNIWTIYGQC